MEVGEVGESLPLIAVASTAAFELYLKLPGEKKHAELPRCIRQLALIVEST